jgi:multiple sugar transport system substrate-binding protein
MIVFMLASLMTACGNTTATPTASNQTTVPISSDVLTPEATAPLATVTDATPSGTTPQAPAATAVPNASGGSALTLPANCTSVELQYWNPFTGPDGPFMGQITERFNSEQQNIRVTMTSQAEYYTQLGTAAASGTLPDLAVIHADQVATQAFRNVIRPIGDLVQQIGLEGTDFPTAVWEAGEVAGQRYSIPLDIHPAVLYYNEDLLTAAGLNAAPTNEQEFAQAATALTQGEQKGFLVTSGFFSQQIFQILLRQFGGREFNEDVTEATWNSEAGVQALQWMKDAQSRFGEPNLESDAEVNGFKAGSAAMMINGIWQLTNVTGEGVSFAGRGTAVPQFGTQPAVWAGSHQLALPAQANPDPCKDAAVGMFIAFLLNNSVEWAKAGQIPASNTVRNSPEFLAIEPQASIAPSVENAFFPPSVPGITDAFGPLGEAVTAVMSGIQSDPKTALDEAANRANQILADNKRTYGETPGSQ